MLLVLPGRWMQVEVGAYIKIQAEIELDQLS